jgi:hypothetical protein
MTTLHDLETFLIRKRWHRHDANRWSAPYKAEWPHAFFSLAMQNVFWTMDAALDMQKKLDAYPGTPGTNSGLYHNVSSKSGLVHGVLQALNEIEPGFMLTGLILANPELFEKSTGRAVDGVMKIHYWVIKVVESGDHCFNCFGRVWTMRKDLARPASMFSFEVQRIPTTQPS